MEILLTIAWFIFALILLVSVHEYGHFLVARLLGVKVLRFSIGFGKPLWSWKDKQDTQYVVAAIPLGGYVKMLDEREAPVTPALLPFAFNRQPLWSRTLIVLAGPVFNLIFAVVVYWLVGIVGVQEVVPVVGEVVPHSLAAQGGVTPGDELVSIDHKPTLSWSDVRFVLLSHLGEKGELLLEYKKRPTGELRRGYLALQEWQIADPEVNLLKSIGISPYLPKIPLVVAGIVPQSSAAKSGLQIGDKIKRINDQPLEYWQDMVQYVENRGGQEVKLDIVRQGKTLSLPFTLGEIKQKDGKTTGFLGVESLPPDWPPDLLRERSYSPWNAIKPAFQKTWDVSVLSVMLLKKMVMGAVSPASLSGPIGVAQGIRYSASLGAAYFLSILGLISINLAIVNLLPIPLLDGGHLLYFVIEGVTRKPVSEKVQRIGLQMGMFILATLMMLAFYNDLMRLQ